MDVLKSPVAFTPRGVNMKTLDALKMFLADMSDDDEVPSEDEDNESSGILVTESMILEATGEDDCSRVTQLILRDRRVAAFDPGCAMQLCALTSLSLSHNRIKSLDNTRFGDNFFVGLRELNLNFNQLTGCLDGLTAPHLTKLFLSSNKLDDSLFGAAPVASSSSCSLSTGALPLPSGFARRFPKLVSLCLFRNGLSDLGAVLAELRQLPKLKELDLDGNPFVLPAVDHGGDEAGDKEGGGGGGWYRHSVVRSLGHRFEQLDGEVVGLLDRQLAEAYFRSAPSSSPPSRPTSASAGGASARGLQRRPGTSNCSHFASGPDQRDADNDGMSELKSSFDWSELPSDDDDSGDERLPGGAGEGLGKFTPRNNSGNGRAGTASSSTTLKKSDHVLLGYLASDALGLSAAAAGEQEDESAAQGVSAPPLAALSPSREKAEGGAGIGTSPLSPLQVNSPPPASSISAAASAGAKASSPPRSLGSPYDEACDVEFDDEDEIEEEGERDSSEVLGGGRAPRRAFSVPPLALPPSSSSSSSGKDGSGSGAAPATDPAAVTSRSGYARQVKDALPPTARNSGGAPPVDMSDPYAVIRRLIKMVEMLKDEKLAQEHLEHLHAQQQQQQRRGAGSGEGDSDEEDSDGESGGSILAPSSSSSSSRSGNASVVTVLQRELTELRIENANMFLLQEENRTLSDKASRVDAAEAKAKELEKECSELREQLKKTSAQLQALHLQQTMQGYGPSSSPSPFAFPSSRTSTSGGGDSRGAPLTPAAHPLPPSRNLLSSSSTSSSSAAETASSFVAAMSAPLLPVPKAPTTLPSVSSLTSSSAPLVPPQPAASTASADAAGAPAAAGAASGRGGGGAEAGPFSMEGSSSALSLSIPSASSSPLDPPSSMPPPARPMTAAQVLDECEDEMDEEIAMLLAANEKGLKQVRHDLKKAKKEMERKERQSQQPRQKQRPEGGGEDVGEGSSSRKLQEGSARPQSSFSSSSSSRSRRRPESTSSSSGQQRPSSSATRTDRSGGSSSSGGGGNNGGGSGGASDPSSGPRSQPPVSLTELLAMRRSGAGSPRPAMGSSASSSSSSSSSPRPETATSSKALGRSSSSFRATTNSASSPDSPPSAGQKVHPGKRGDSSKFNGADVWIAGGSDDDEDEDEEEDVEGSPSPSLSSSSSSFSSSSSSSPRAVMQQRDGNSKARQSSLSRSSNLEAPKSAASAVPAFSIGSIKAEKGGSDHRKDTTAAAARSGGAGGAPLRSPRPSRAHSTYGPVTTRVKAAGDPPNQDGSSGGGATRFLVQAGQPSMAAASRPGDAESGPTRHERATPGNAEDSATDSLSHSGRQNERAGKVAPRSNGTFGDVITVHSPRQAALICGLLS